MPDVLLRHPGVVVLHDFFLSGMQDWRQTTGVEGAFINALVHSPGYQAIRHLVSEGVVPTIDRYPANGPVVHAAAGVIVHSKTSMDRLIEENGVAAGGGVRHIRCFASIR